MRSTLLITLLLTLLTGVASAEGTRESGDSELRTQRRARFFSAVRDLRRCPSPQCGGWMVSAVNHPRTRCADGELREACHVLHIDTRRAGKVALPAGGALLLRGRIARRPLEVAGLSEPAAVFRARRVWRAAGDSGLLRDPVPEGDFVRVRRTGIVCITEPCGYFFERFLNARLRRVLHRLDLSGVPASLEDVERAQRALETRAGLMAVGK
ncbi:MAG: DUF6748 domain-containing protein, partial [Myxococcota bacterium]